MYLQLSPKRSAFCALFCFSALFATSGCGHSAQYYLSRGNELYAQGKYDDAALNYQKAIQKDSNSGDAFYRLGLADLKANRPADAYNVLSRAVTLLPGRDDVKVQFGDVLLAGYLADPHRPKRLYDELTRIAQDLRARQSNSFDALRFQGEIASIDGKLSEASAAFEAANRIRPLETNVAGPWIDVLFRNNEDARAQTLAQELIRKHGDYVPIYLLLYKRDMAAGRTADAETVLKQCAQANPNQSTVLLLLTGHYYKLHNTAAAAAALQPLITDHKTFPNGVVDAGDFYLHAGDPEQAIRIYNQGLQSD
ncbi:MAG: tetratricopeptide repeat protein, partial [Acidobacteriaceae bacterium]|nr:tetratricopeptide repeat protein [Acidobacteriaceae bacterium]